ncbi:hypothetical protein LTR95_008628 [Oleoguttula sp. CCFEE 5521]
MAAFEYAPLSADDDIRLLQVDGLAPDGSLLCSIFAVHRRDLLDGLTYTALTYRWGDLNDAGALQMRNGEDTDDDRGPYRWKALPLSTLAMLKDLYLNVWIAKAYMWIDDFCLNQVDVSEKNAQVKHMGSIYALADKVIVYAGPEVPDTGLAVAFWNRLHNVFESMPQRG